MSFKGIVPLLLVSTSLLGSQAAMGEDCLHYGGYSHWLGNIQFEDGTEVLGLAVSGTTAYFGTKRFTEIRFRTADITNPLDTQILGTLTWPGAQPGPLVASGSIVYLTDGNAGLRLVDVSDPGAPSLMGQVNAPSAFSADVALQGSLAYLADTNQGLHIVDVSDPNNPVIIGGVDTPGDASGIAMLGPLAFIADGSYSGLQIIDVSSPNSPAIVGSVVTPGTAKDVFVSGHLAYVADGLRGLQIIDVLNPASPTIVGSLLTSDELNSVWVIGAKAFLPVGYEGLLVVDVSDPALPFVADRIPTYGPARGVVGTDGNRVFVKSGGVGYDEFYISSLNTPPLVGHLEGLPAYPSSAFISGSMAYLTDYLGLELIDVSDPSAPQLVGSLDTPDLCYDAAVSGSMAYLAARSAGLQVVDVSDPQNPIIVGSLLDTLGYDLNAVEVSGSVGYLAFGGSGLQLADLSNPSIPTRLGHLSIPCLNVTVSGSWAYLTNGRRIVVADVTDPNAPEEIGSVFLPDRVRDIARSGSFLYAATIDSGLQVVDISNPSSPLIVGHLAMPSPAEGTRIQALDTYVYLATNWKPSGLVVIDVSVPSSPKLVGNIDADVYAATVSGSLLYICAGDLLVAPIQCAATTAVLPEEPRKSKGLGLAFPNPANGAASTIPFTVSQGGRVTLRVLDIAGREVRTIVDEAMDAGQQSAIWDGRDNRGNRTPAGIYFYQLRAPGFEATRKLVRVRN